MYIKPFIMDNNNSAGALLGVVAGIYKGIENVINSTVTNYKPILALITWENAFDTAVLALIGGIVGTLGSELVKFVKKLRSKKDDKKGD